MSLAPLEIRIAFDHGYAQFMHETTELAIASGVTKITLAPTSPELIWQYFMWTFGQIEPKGPTSDLYFVHWQEGVKKHADPMVHSLVDFEYPIWANATVSNPHYIDLHNNTGATQTLDVQFWMAAFPNKKAYMNWYCDLILLGYRNNISDLILSAMRASRGEFEATLIKRREEAYMVRREVYVVNDLPTNILPTNILIRKPSSIPTPRT